MTGRSIQKELHSRTIGVVCAEWWQANNSLTVKIEALAAGGQNPAVAALGEDTIDKFGTGVNDLFAVIQENQHCVRCEVAQHVVEVRPVLQAQAKSGCDCRGQLIPREH